MKLIRCVYFLNIKKLIFLFLLANCFICCKVRTGNKVSFGKSFKRIIYSTNSLFNLPPISIAKDSPLFIHSISTLDRELKDGSYRNIDTSVAKCNVSFFEQDSAFNRMLRRINTLKDITKYKIEYDGKAKNDSIYKNIFTDSFKNNFSIYDMQKIDFSSFKQNGIYLVFTRVNSVLWSPEDGTLMTFAGNPSVTIVNTHYEFFRVENGKLIEYAGYRIGHSNFWVSKVQNSSPRLIDLKWVIKQLRKQSEKYYGKS